MWLVLGYHLHSPLIHIIIITITVFVLLFTSVPGMPRIINIKMHTYMSVFVVWEAPAEKNGILRGYRLFWSKGDMEWNITLGNVNGYNITNLGTC